jgi:UDP-glucose 4-epimerase
MKVVVTGGAGFIGSNLVGHLVRHGTEVTVVDDLSTGYAANLAGIEPVRFLRGSILDGDLMDRACTGVDAIVHLAARPSVPRSIANPVATHEANASGTLAVLEAARRAGGPHVVSASSSSVYGANPALPKSEDLRPIPLSPYAASKLAAESYVLAYGTCFDLPVLPLRFFNVFGPNQSAGHAYAAVIPTFVAAALAGEALTVHGDGKQTRDFTFVGSVVSVLADAVARGVTSSDPVNLAFGAHRTVLEAVECIERIVDRPLTLRHVEPRAGDVRHSEADQSRLRRLFPDVEPVAFADGLARTVEWYRSR